METYMSLVKGTGKEGSMDAGRAAIEAAGCREVATYLLMGQYDVLVIVEAPDAMHAAAAIWAARQAAGEGPSATETMRAFTAEEMKTLGRMIHPSG